MPKHFRFASNEQMFLFFFGSQRERQSRFFLVSFFLRSVRPGKHSVRFMVWVEDNYSNSRNVTPFDIQAL